MKIKHLFTILITFLVMLTIFFHDVEAYELKLVETMQGPGLQFEKTVVEELVGEIQTLINGYTDEELIGVNTFVIKELESLVAYAKYYPSSRNIFIFGVGVESIESISNSLYHELKHHWCFMNHTWTEGICIEHFSTEFLYPRLPYKYQPLYGTNTTKLQLTRMMLEKGNLIDRFYRKGSLISEYHIDDEYQFTAFDIIDAIKSGEEG